MKKKILSFKKFFSFQTSLKVIIAFATGLSIGHYFFEVPSTPLIQTPSYM
ncbi:MAG: hypothetical protein IBJ00_02840, partial [Alphaproteobacteria bacterium]|nr:hypothetical protein [Alphaproteobacteria bacterium]